MAEGHPEDGRQEKADQPQTPPSPPVLDYYHAPRRPSRVMKWLRWLPRPSWMTVVVALLSAAASYWFSVDHAAWVVVRQFDGDLPSDSNAVIPPDGKRLLTILPREPYTIRVYDIATGHALIELQPSTDWHAWQGEFSPDGGRIWAVGLGCGGFLWDASSGQLLATWGIDASNYVYMKETSPFSSYGRYLMVENERWGDEVWDIAVRCRVASDQGGRWDRDKISPDGSRISLNAVSAFPSLKPLAPFPDGLAGQRIWLPDGQAIVITDDRVYDDRTDGIRLIGRRRPEAVYGFLWRPQFWLVVIGATASVWLMYRDVRRWRRNPPALGFLAALHGLSREMRF